MGTNYYTIPKLTEVKKSQIIEALNKEEFLKAKNLIPESIHIGKSSMGWQFIFNHNNWDHFSKSLNSLKEFISNNEIVDEYNSPLTTEEFWHLVKIKGSLSRDPYTELHFKLIFSDSTQFS